MKLKMGSDAINGESEEEGLALTRSSAYCLGVPLRLGYWQIYSFQSDNQ